MWMVSNSSTTSGQICNAVLRYSSSHPSSGPANSKRAHSTQSRGTHGEVADQIPDQASELDDAREESEDRALQLSKSQHAEIQVLESQSHLRQLRSKASRQASRSRRK